jgi:hypothetical protein
MTIRNKDMFMDRLWDWAILDGCFGNTKIKPTDVDGMVERNGYFLLLETKGKNVALNQGQRIYLERLRSTGIFTNLVIWGECGTPNKIFFMGSSGEKTIDPADLDTLRSIVSQWFEYADKQPRIT